MEEALTCMGFNIGVHREYTGPQVQRSYFSPPPPLSPTKQLRSYIIAHRAEAHRVYVTFGLPSRSEPTGFCQHPSVAGPSCYIGFGHSFPKREYHLLCSSHEV